jgi:hypothetical protein
MIMCILLSQQTNILSGTNLNTENRQLNILSYRILKNYPRGGGGRRGGEGTPVVTEENTMWFHKSLDTAEERKNLNHFNIILQSTAKSTQRVIKGTPSLGRVPHTKCIIRATLFTRSSQHAVP